MPKFGQIKRNDLIKYFRKIGFNGPFSGGKHQFMQKSNITVRIPNPHKPDIGKELLERVLKHADVSRLEWGKL